MKFWHDGKTLFIGEGKLSANLKDENQPIATWSPYMQEFDKNELTACLNAHYHPESGFNELTLIKGGKGAVTDKSTD